jgi:SAM-dependent methyltransferase
MDPATVSGFGYEWKTFDQKYADPSELKKIFEQYFSIFPWESMSVESAVAADFGCGSGRWAIFLAPKVKHLHLIDASVEALAVARQNLKDVTNVSYHLGSIEQSSVDDESLDFGFSLGVLHHLPDTERAVRDIAQKLKRGAPFLVYLYYALDGRPGWYRSLWRTSDFVRKIVSHLPPPVKLLVSFSVASLVYWPLARTARWLEKLDCLPKSFPLSFYRHLSWYVMQTDALDRLGTRIEKRYTRSQISDLLTNAGFGRVTFSPSTPFWCAIAYKE